MVTRTPIVSVLGPPYYPNHLNLFIMQIDTESMGKEVVPPKEQDKGKDVVPPSEVTPIETPGRDDDQLEEPHNGKRQNYNHYHGVGGPTNFCKVPMALLLEVIPMTPDFTKHFPSVPHEFKLKTNTECSWRVTVRLLNDTVTLDQGWATFAIAHQIKIGFMVNFKLLTPKS
ncbi:U-box domain-containing protein 4 [Hordeum vulgare]|nr:U-box domain-containing protein 4 [Hordeum vulgare]